MLKYDTTYKVKKENTNLNIPTSLIFLSESFYHAKLHHFNLPDIRNLKVPYQLIFSAFSHVNQLFVTVTNITTLTVLLIVEITINYEQ